MHEPLTRYAYLGNNLAVTVTPLGHRLLIDTRNKQSLSIITHGHFERKVAWVIEKLVQRNQRVVDAGANIGFFTLQLCAQVGPQGRVVAVEPNPHIFSLLSDTLHINAMGKRCSAHQNALMDRACKLDLTWTDSEHGGGRLVTGRITPREEQRAEVECVTIDSLIEEGPVDFIKIDTEGTEAFVLYGAEKTLAANPNCVVLTEWVPKFLDARGIDVPQASEWIAERFANIYLVDKVGEIKQLQPEDLTTIGFSNILLANQDLQSALR